ncbi:type III secretion system inner membrane ring subunit SctD [Aeromonas salmonicida]|uniref:type III secretion system inner membrane ring subunit SctD n=1 Tax=Aeromonas salmonicida TaxID=645 RepID=UPI00259DC616|nr:type III secretion system inner membrane ring subunit SctD [Aeromonas salmonicida]MDM5065587.1 type III secretion system inner membrane ring subunit SctD [Aeromonas salmonicida]
MEQTYKLRWLNGLLAGRELALPEGEIRLGGDDPDIALSLENGAATVLMVSEAGVTLNPPLPTWVDGLPWDSAQPLPLMRVIDLAGQGLILGDADTELPTPSVPPRRAAPATDAGASSPVWRWLLMPAVLPIAATAAFLLLTPAPAPVVPVKPADWLAQQMAHPDYHGLQARLDENDTVHLSGMAAAEHSLRRLQQKIREQGLNLSDRSLSAEGLRYRVRDMLAMQGYRHVDVTPDDTPDSVIIYGDIRSDKNWLATRDKLGEVEMLKRWRVVNDRAGLFDSLLTTLNAESLLEGLSISTTHNELVVSGQQPPDRAAKIHAAVEAFNHATNPRLRARYQNIPPPTLADGMLPAAIVSVGGNADSVYLQLVNNMRIRQGTTLPNGYKVYSLTPRHVMLLCQQQLISIPLNL